MSGSLKCLLRQSLGLSSTHHTPYLAFLYQTATILQPWKRSASTKVPSKRRNRPSIKDQRIAALKQRHVRPREQGSALRLNDGFSDDYEPFSKPSKAKSKEIPEQDKVKVEDENRTLPNAFTTILEQIEESDPNKSTYTRNVTMTQAEQQIFERLQQMSGKKKPSKLENELIDEFVPPDGQSSSLEDLFNEVYEPMHKKEQAELRRQETIEQRQEDSYNSRKVKKAEDARAKNKAILLQSLQWNLLQPIESARYRISQPGISDEAIDKLETTRQAHVQELRNLFVQVETDVDLWTLLEKHIFKNMRDLNESLEKLEAEQGRKASQMLKAKATRQSAATKDLPITTHLASNPDKDLLTKVMNTYGPALLYSIRLFRAAFPRSPYAPLVLQTIKKLGPISYVLAASTSFFNELLYIRWVHYRDLNGCADILEEMITQNFLADRRTAGTYQEMERIRSYQLGVGPKERDPSKSVEPEELEVVTTKQPSVPQLNWTKIGTEIIPYGTPVKSFIQGWWRLQGTEAGWLRCTKAYNRLVKITRQEAQRKKDEQALAEQRAAAMLEDSDGQQASTGQASSVGMMDDLEPEIEILSSLHGHQPATATAAG